ncbi:caspase family protein [Amylibacter sp. SFDW26]|uniref:caspase family protein n=1 Tax=Amylibacter sp. SFDW26 TaxID=2652722 RepID=UPI001262A9AD|nr:caspase family protein [Amylibacter sp. SFDW26]KAB7614732.1 caspase family protein [Amylibacter sp. SFDW26]
MSIKHLWVIFIVFISMPISTAIAQPQHIKIALVIGNSNYKTLPNLKNAAGDATAIALVLSDLGFTVFLTQNTTSADLKKTLSFVANQALEADQVIIYFAGHGHSEDGVAALLPIDANRTAKNAITAAGLLDYFKNPFTQKAIIIDACLEEIPNGINATSKSILLPANLYPETAFIFATSYGQVAYDGTGSHSLFSGALLDKLVAKETDLIRTIQSVRSDVIQASRSHQMPITLSTLTRPFELKGQTIKYKYAAPAHTVLQSYSSTGFSNKPLLDDLADGPIK